MQTHRILFFLLFPLLCLAQTVPPVYQGLVSELESQLASIDSSVDAEWDGSLYPTRYSADLIVCNSQIQKTRLLNPAVLTLSLQMLDALGALGLTTVRINIGYPFLVDEFPDSDRYLTFYRTVVDAARTRGYDVFINCTSTSNQIEYGRVDSTVSSFFEGLDGNRYRTEKRRMIETIIDSLQPDYLTIENEPQTMENATGLDHSPDSLMSYLDYFLEGLDKKSIPIGAGVGNWEPMEYVERLVDIPELDYVDIHVYPVNFDFFDDRLFRIHDEALAHGKDIILGECWLYKTSDEEILAQLVPVDVLKRDVFGFWSPLDSTFLRIVSKFAHHVKAEIVTMYWSSLFFGNLDYETGFEDLTVDSLFALLNIEVYENMLDGILSPLGETYESIVREACECGLEYDPSTFVSDDPDFILATNYPNPFNASTTIMFTLEEPFYGRTVVSLHDIQGRAVQILLDEWLSGGTHHLRFTPANLPTGLYMYKIQAGHFSRTRRMLLIR